MKHKKSGRDKSPARIWKPANEFVLPAVKSYTTIFGADVLQSLGPALPTTLIWTI